MKKYTVFIIYAYDLMAENGDFIKSVECQIIAKDEEEATKRVKELCPDKKFTYLKTIIEKYVEN
jgi:hypothetical protein